MNAAHFELGNVEGKDVRRRVVYELFNNVDHDFAVHVAEGVGIEPPEEPGAELPDHDERSPPPWLAHTVTTRLLTTRPRTATLELQESGVPGWKPT